MIDGQKVSPLIFVPHIPCCSQPAVALDTHAETSNTEELEGTSDDELQKAHSKSFLDYLQKAHVQAEKMDEEIADKGVSTLSSDESPSVFKPSEACKEGAAVVLDMVYTSALKASESSAAAVKKPLGVTATKVQNK